MPSAAEVLIVLSTFPDADKAAEIARILVEEQLVACVGIVHDDGEVLAIIKTTRDRYDQVAGRIVQLHPYELPLASASLYRPRQTLHAASV